MKEGFECEDELICLMNASFAAAEALIAEDRWRHYYFNTGLRRLAAIRKELTGHRILRRHASKNEMRLL